MRQARSSVSLCPPRGGASARAVLAGAVRGPYRAGFCRTPRHRVVGAGGRCLYGRRELFGIDLSRACRGQWRGRAARRDRELAGSVLAHRRAQPRAFGALRRAGPGYRGDAWPRQSGFGTRLPRLSRHFGARRQPRDEVPDQRRGELRKLPRPGGRLARGALHPRRHPCLQCRRRDDPARAAADARQRLPRLPLGQREGQPVRYPFDDGGGASAVVVRARPVQRAPAAPCRGRRLYPPQGPHRQRAPVGGGPGRGGAPPDRSLRQARLWLARPIPRIRVLRLPQLPSPDHRRAAAQADLRDQSGPPDPLRQPAVQ